MALTFFDILSEQRFNVDDVDEIEVDKDIVSKKITGYFAIIGDMRIEISGKVYDELEKHLNK